MGFSWYGFRVSALESLTHALRFMAASAFPVHKFARRLRIAGWVVQGFGFPVSGFVAYIP